MVLIDMRTGRQIVESLWKLGYKRYLIILLLFIKKRSRIWMMEDETDDERNFIKKEINPARVSLPGIPSILTSSKIM